MISKCPGCGEDLSPTVPLTYECGTTITGHGKDGKPWSYVASKKCLLAQVAQREKQAEELLQILDEITVAGGWFKGGGHSDLPELVAKAKERVGELERRDKVAAYQLSAETRRAERLACEARDWGQLVNRTEKILGMTTFATVPSAGSVTDRADEVMQALAQAKEQLAQVTDGTVNVAGQQVPIVKPLANLAFAHELTAAFGLTEPGILSVSNAKLIEHAKHLAAIPARYAEVKRRLAGIKIDRDHSDVLLRQVWQALGGGELGYQWAGPGNIVERAEQLKAIVDTRHDWCCGCGHWNGPNLPVCGMCKRTPQESLPVSEAAQAAKAQHAEPAGEGGDQT